ncbi:MAG: hypothetical protein RIS04_1562 [Pseudomonadota bacterium]
MQGHAVNERAAVNAALGLYLKLFRRGTDYPHKRYQPQKRWLE